MSQNTEWRKSQKTPLGCVRAILPSRRVMECCVRWPDLASTIPRPQPNWDGLWWVGPQSEGKAAKKCLEYLGTPSRRLEKHSRWSWLREYQECVKLSSRQRVATLKNLKYQTYFYLFNTFLVTTWFHLCYFIVLMSSLLFYNVEYSKNNENPLNV